MSTTPRSPRSRVPSTPPSRVPSRAGTPVPGRSPSRMASPPVVPPVPSLSNLRVYSHGSATSATNTPSASGSPSGRMERGNSSSASSVAEGILFQEPDADVDVIDGEQGSAAGLVESHAGNDESKKNLRDQLRRTLSKKESFTGERAAIIPGREGSLCPSRYIVLPTEV